MPCMKGKNSPIMPSTINAQPTTRATAFFTPQVILFQHKMREAEVKVTEDYVSTIFGRRTLVLAPKKQRQNQHNGPYRQMEAPNSLLQCVPVLSEKISNGGDHRHPERRSQEIEHDEGLPRHT